MRHRGLVAGMAEAPGKLRHERRGAHQLRERWPDARQPPWSSLLSRRIFQGDEEATPRRAAKSLSRNTTTSARARGPRAPQQPCAAWTGAPAHHPARLPRGRCRCRFARHRAPRSQRDTPAPHGRRPRCAEGSRGVRPRCRRSHDLMLDAAEGLVPSSRSLPRAGHSDARFGHEIKGCRGGLRGDSRSASRSSRRMPHARMSPTARMRGGSTPRPPPKRTSPRRPKATRRGLPPPAEAGGDARRRCQRRRREPMTHAAPTSAIAPGAGTTAKPTSTSVSPITMSLKFRPVPVGPPSRSMTRVNWAS